MKVKKLNRGYTLFLTDNEYAVMMNVLEQYDSAEGRKSMTTGQRKAWSRRIRGGSFLRVDRDTRKAKA